MSNISNGCYNILLYLETNYKIDLIEIRLSYIKPLNCLSLLLCLTLQVLVVFPRLLGRAAEARCLRGQRCNDLSPGGFPLAARVRVPIFWIFDLNLSF